jgi:hypothetical protein
VTSLQAMPSYSQVSEKQPPRSPPPWSTTTSRTGS